MDYIKFGRAFDILHRKTQAFITAACEPLKLTYSEYVLLMQILLTEGKTQDELAEILKMDKSSITRTINLLLEKKLISREFDAADRRFKRIFATEKTKSNAQYLDGVLKNWMNILGFNEDTPEVKLIEKEVLRAAEAACNAIKKKAEVAK